MSSCLLEILIIVAGTAGAICLVILPIWLHIKYPHLMEYHPCRIDYSELWRNASNGENHRNTVLAGGESPREERKSRNGSQKEEQESIN